MKDLHAKQPPVTGSMYHYREPKENNVRFTENIKEKPYSVRAFTIEDINGYRLTFTEVTTRA